MVNGDLLNDPNPPGPKFKKENLYWLVLKSWMISQPLIFNLFLIIMFVFHLDQILHIVHLLIIRTVCYFILICL